MEVENQNKVAINVTGIESKDGKVTLLMQEEGRKYPTKYSFFMMKQDGQPSKAFTQFTELGVQIGKVYVAEIKETVKQNPMSGKDVTYRNIMWFYTGKDATLTSVPKQTKNAPQVNLEALTAKIAEGFSTRDAKIKDLEKRVHILEFPDEININEVPY